MSTSDLYINFMTDIFNNFIRTDTINMEDIDIIMFSETNDLCISSREYLGRLNSASKELYSATKEVEEPVNQIVSILVDHGFDREQCIKMLDHLMFDLMKELIFKDLI